MANRDAQEQRDYRNHELRLTDAATRLVARTQRVLSLLEEAEAELEGSEDAVSGRITISAEYATQLALVAAGFGTAVLPRLGRGALPKGVTVLSFRGRLFVFAQCSIRIEPSPVRMRRVLPPSPIRERSTRRRSRRSSPSSPRRRSSIWSRSWG